MGKGWRRAERMGAGRVLTDLRVSDFLFLSLLKRAKSRLQLTLKDREKTKIKASKEQPDGT